MGRIRAFFSGRNGFDIIATVVLIASLVVMVVSSFVGIEWLSAVLYLCATAGYVYSIWRAFSRNIYKRSAECASFREFFRLRKLMWKERKTHRYFRCPSCKAWVRVPKGRGAITITCRVCNKRFDKKS